MTIYIYIYDIKLFNIAILLHQSSPTTSIFGPKEIFGTIDPSGSNSSIKFDLVGHNTGPLHLNAGPTVNIETSYEDNKQYDLVLVSAIGVPQDQHFIDTESRRTWLNHQHKGGAHIASICTGAFIIADSGIAANKKLTTHWLMESKFRTRFRDILLTPEALVLQEDRIWSSGGAFAYQDLCLSIIDYFWGANVAQNCANLLMLEPARKTQTQFVTLSSFKLHGDSKVRDIQKFMEQNYRDNIEDRELANQFHLSERQILRRFKKATGISPSQYLQQVRINVAKDLLKNSNTPLSLIPQQIGYEDAAYVRQIFKRHTDKSPSEYRKAFR